LSAVVETEDTFVAVVSVVVVLSEDGVELSELAVSYRQILNTMKPVLQC